MIFQIKMNDGTRILFHRDDDGNLVVEELMSDGTVRTVWRLDPEDANALRKFLRTQGFE